VFRPQVDFLPVLSDVGEGVATYHGRVLSLLLLLLVVVVVVGREGSLEVVCSPGDVSPGRVLATVVVVVVKVGHVWTNGVGVVELLHERASRVGIGHLVLLLLPGMVDN